MWSLDLQHVHKSGFNEKKSSSDHGSVSELLYSYLKSSQTTISFPWAKLSIRFPNCPVWAMFKGDESTVNVIGYGLSQCLTHLAMIYDTVLFLIPPCIQVQHRCTRRALPRKVSNVHLARCWHTGQDARKMHVSRAILTDRSTPRIN